MVINVVSLAGQLREVLPILDGLMKIKTKDTAHPTTTKELPTPLAHHRLTAEDADELAQAYQDGATLKDLTRRFSIAQTTVLAHLDRQGVARRQPVGLSPKDVKEATRLYASGSNLKQVGRKLGFDPKTVRKYLTDAGVIIRPGRGRR